MSSPEDIEAGADGLMVRAAYFLGVAVGSAAEVLLMPYRFVTEKPARQPGAAPQHGREPAARGQRLLYGGSAAPGRTSVRRDFEDERVPAPARRSTWASAGDEGAHPALDRALSDPDPAVRRRALRTVGELSDDRATGVLTEVLHDPDPSVRCAAAAAAARSRASGVVFSLILALDDPDPDVRAASQLAIEEITGEGIDASAVEDPKKRRKLVDGLKRWWKERRFAELATLDDSEPGL